MKFNIVPYKSVGEITFTMTRDQVRANLRDDFKEFKKSKSSKSNADDFKFCHVFYDVNDKIEAVEFFAKEEVNLTFKGHALLKLSFSELKKLLVELDPDTEVKKGDITSYKFGIGAGNGSVIVFKKNYYSK